MYRASIAILGSIPCLVLPARAQVQEKWLHEYDGAPTGHDEIQSVAVAPSGDVFAIGQTGFNDALTLKYDAGGTLLWSRTFTLGGGLDVAYDVAVVPSTDDVYVVGRADAQSTSGMVLKYDASGTLLWSAIYSPGQGTVQFSTARLRANGNLVALGVSGDGLIAVEYDSQGHLLWSTPIPGGDYVYDAAIDFTGNLILVGPFNAANDTTHFGIAKVSPSGTLLWTRTITGGGAGIESASALAVDRLGAIYASGRIIDATAGVSGVLFKLDPAGNVLWTRTHRGTLVDPPVYSEAMRTVAFAPDGNVRVAGQTANIGTETDVFVAEYTPSGSLVWQDTWNGPLSADDAVLHMTTEADGSMKVLGRTEGALGVYDPVVLRWNVHGGLRWSSIEQISSPVRFHFIVAAAGTGGTSVFGGMVPAEIGVPSNGLVLDLRDQAVPFCFGDGSAGDCPCGNQAARGEGQGCVNSSGAAARLTDAGQASLGHDTLVLTSSGEISSAPSLLLQSRTAALPTTFGDGLRCLGSQFLRLYVRAATAGVATTPGAGDPPISARSAALGDPLAVGATRFYQMCYRDNVTITCPPPLGSSFNVSSGLTVSWAR